MAMLHPIGDPLIRWVLFWPPNPPLTMMNKTPALCITHARGRTHTHKPIPFYPPATPCSGLTAFVHPRTILSDRRRKQKQNEEMKAAACVPLLAVLAGFAKPGTSCVDLEGIIPGGGEGLLDLDFLLTPENSLTAPLAPLGIIRVCEWWTTR